MMAQRIRGDRTGGIRRSSGPSAPRRAPARAVVDRTPHCACGGGCPRCGARASAQTLGSGQPLDRGIRRTLEASYGADLSEVRVHTGPAAAEASSRANARAFTAGSDIVFGRDQYRPGTRDGFDRIAHEVAHTLQQRNGRGAAGAGARAGAEREAAAAAGAAYEGRQADVSMRTAGLLQRQDADETPRYFTSQPEFQLHLDPEIEAMMLRNYLRWWIGSSITEGEPAAEGDPSSGQEAPGTGSGQAGGSASTGVPPPHELPPDFFTPFDPAELSGEPDVGSILGPYNARNVPLGARDVDAATSIYQQNYRFVSVLPDLRSAAPDFLRPLIPTDWRRSIAEAFTAATLNAQLKHDYPTPIEAADLSFYRMTGVSTTYIPIPGFSF
jgi:hypothetical protein